MRILACRVIALCVCALVARAEEIKVPEAPPPPELVGRWLEKSATRKGDLVGYTLYCFSRKSDFLVLSRVRNERTQQWVDAKSFYGKERASLLGYFDASDGETLKLNVVVLAMSVLPVELRYRAQGDTLTLSRDVFDPTSDRQVHCVRVTRLPGESAADAAAFAKRLEEGLNGPGFRRVFEHAAHEMSEHPSDNEMLASFLEHREELDALRKMLDEDKELKRVDFDFTKPSDLSAIGVTAERIASYRELCKRAELERCVEVIGNNASDAIRFIASARGLSVSGSAKSFVWLRESPGKDAKKIIVDDLDAFARKKLAERRLYFAAHKRAMSNASFDAFRHIEGNWWLEYQFVE